MRRCRGYESYELTRALILGSHSDLGELGGGKRLRFELDLGQRFLLLFVLTVEAIDAGINMIFVDDFTIEDDILDLLVLSLLVSAGVR